MTESVLSKKPGFHRLNESNRNEAERTIIVLGEERGGTSMVAGALRLLGVYMGEDLTTTHENYEFFKSIVGDERGLVDFLLIPFRLITSYPRLVDEYNKRHKVWGTKIFTSRGTIVFLLARYLRNPVYIFVVRNPLSVAGSQATRDQRPFKVALSRILQRYESIFSFVKKTSRPVLLIDYEAALNDREGVVNAIAEYCGIEPDPECMNAAVAFMDKDKSYQFLVVGEKVVGFVESVTSNQVSGWAFSPELPEPITLGLLQNGKEILRCVASLPRNDVFEHPTYGRQYCGFVFDLSSCGEAPNIIEALQVVDLRSGKVIRKKFGLA